MCMYGKDNVLPNKVMNYSAIKHPISTLLQIQNSFLKGMTFISIFHLRERKGS